VIKIGVGEIQQVLHRDMPVVTLEQIAAVHGVSIKTVQSSYREHKARFQEGKHVFHLDFAEASQLLAGQGVKASPNGLTLFTEAGYLLLVKPMRDETAWQVQERMIEAYFRARDGSGSAIGELSEGAMLVRMAMAYHEQEKRIKAIEAHQQHEQALMIQAQKDMIALQAQHLALQEHVIEAKDMALTAIQSMQWVTIRQYVEIYRMQRQMPPSVQRRYATWLTTCCLERGSAMYTAATADKEWPHEKTYCIAIIQDTLSGWLRRYSGTEQEHL
jgi:phage regulator Rha-like protein